MLVSEGPVTPKPIQAIAAAAECPPEPNTAAEDAALSVHRIHRD